MKVASIVGARPNFIKLASVSREPEGEQRDVFDDGKAGERIGGIIG